MKKHHKFFIRVISWIFFIIYLVCMVYFLFFSEQLGRVPSDEYKYSLEPFKEIRRYLTYRSEIGTFNVILNLLGNIVCFVPFGFVVPILSPRHKGFFKIAWLSFCVSLLVELVQLVSKVGSCDVDDIILNTLGGITGYLLFACSNRCLHHLLSLQKRKKEKE